MSHCVPLRPFWPPVPPISRALPPLSALPVCLPVLLFFFCFFFVVALPAAPARPDCAPCSSPCYPCPAALRPLSRLSPLPFSFSLSILPVRLPSLSVPRCHSCVPPACSTPAPPSRPYPFPWVLPRSPPLTPSWLPGALCGEGGVYLWPGLWPCLWSGMAVGCLRTMSHRMCRMNTERTPGRRLSNSRRCICIVEPSRIDKVRTPLHHVGVPWRRWPPRPGVVYSSEQGARKLHVFNAAPSCHAESFAAMYQVGG